MRQAGVFYFFSFPPPARPSERTAEIMLSEENRSGLKSHGLFARFTSVPQVSSTQLQARCCRVRSSGSVRAIRQKCVKLLLTLSRQNAENLDIFIARVTGLCLLFFSGSSHLFYSHCNPRLKPLPTGLTHLLFSPRFKG